MLKHTTALLLMLISHSTFACLFHAQVSTSQLNIPSGADWTILRAMKLENNRELEPITKLESTAGFQRATWWLQLLTKDLEDKGIKETYIYLADVGLWSYYQSTSPNKISFEIEPEGDFPYLVLTQVTLSNIVSGNITFNQAMSARLMFSS